MIRAVFWDYYNTILETADAHWNKHKTVLARHGIELKETFRKRIYENNGNQNWEWMKEALALKIPQKEYLEAVDAEFQNYMINLEMRPGVQELFTLINTLKIPQAIITNARQTSAKPVLEEKNIAPLMKFILFKEDYEGRKPDPTPYLCGIKKMAEILSTLLLPKECLAIEDDPKGVDSAHRAGATVIHRKLSENEADSPYADYCCFHKEDFLKIMSRLLRAEIL